MQIILLTVGIVAALMAGMAVGVIFSNKPLRGSCGGVGGAGSCACEEAGTPNACKIEPGVSAATPIEFKAPGELMSLRKG
ncbi:hypothetical protein DB30_00454 [Enhygromyxa salina]|uniref:ApbE family protein n=1 Tax=Enhygromyxa salina TaxID=215803 RepID=A0A0C2CPY9_9BACT|nr:(Na+)-NQR maturation NqrM [Enhygromyxa salina]KIG13231.1 hypothetical protein DB30_00454 [Enhygromyxa salina]